MCDVIRDSGLEWSIFTPLYCQFSVDSKTYTLINIHTF